MSDFALNLSCSLLQLPLPSSAAQTTLLFCPSCSCLHALQQVFVAAATRPLLCSPAAVYVQAGMTWDELVLVVNEQPWPEDSPAGRGGSQVRDMSFIHKFAHNPNFFLGARFEFEECHGGVVQDEGKIWPESKSGSQAGKRRW